MKKQLFQSTDGRWYPIRAIKYINPQNSDGSHYVFMKHDDVTISPSEYAFITGDYTAMNSTDVEGDTFPAPAGWKCFSTEEGCNALYDLIAFRIDYKANWGNTVAYLSPWGAYEFAVSPDGKVYSYDRVWASVEAWNEATQREVAE